VVDGLLPTTIGDWVILLLAFVAGAWVAYNTTGVGPNLVPFSCGFLVGSMFVGLIGGLLISFLGSQGSEGGPGFTINYGFFGGVAGAAVGAIIGWRRG
jgi:hypothetical protein